MFPLVTILVVLVVIFVTGLIAIRRIARIARGHPAHTEANERVIQCDNCGYDLRGLNYPRCPECGALRGFDVPVDDLTLTEAERRKIDDRCRGLTSNR